MRRMILIVVSIACACTSAPACAVTKATLLGEMHRLANNVKKSLAEDPRVKDRGVALGEFAGEGDAKDSNFGLRIRQLLESELAAVLKAKAELTLAGSYHFLTPDPALSKAKILAVTVQIKDQRGREITGFSVDINDTDDIMQVLGLTGAAPHTAQATFQERNEAARRAEAQPTFDLVEGTRVAAKGFPQWSVGVLKKSAFNAAPGPVVPQDVNGLAFVPIAVREYYEIELVNHDKSDAVASVTVDGLDVANTFSVDKDAEGAKMNWPGYLVSAGERMVIRGWLNTIDPSVKDNVFSFRVVELGQGAASELKARGSVGVITVQFREAAPVDGKLSIRSFGETARGEGLEEKLEGKDVQIGENVLSTVSIRYNRPQ